MSDGKLMRMSVEYMASCYHCNNSSTTWAYYYKSAEKDFRDDGWRKRKGKWYCPECAKNKKGLKISKG